MRIGEERAKGYGLEDFTEVFRRYVPISEVEAMKAEWMEVAKDAKERLNSDKQNPEFADSAIQH